MLRLTGENYEIEGVLCFSAFSPECEFDAEPTCRPGWLEKLKGINTNDNYESLLAGLITGAIDE